MERLLAGTGSGEGEFESLLGGVGGFGFERGY